MHIVDGDQGHTHGHSHEHTHEYTHTHEHEHAHGHEGEHNHSHGDGPHEHGNCTGCGGCGQQEHPANEQEAILSYMLDHNKHHAAELLEIAKQFRTAGKDEAAAQIEKAVENFDKGNLYLSVALSLVKEV
jgi:ABC-type Zn2+ transport system substrate-binding protein/surface adhesin